MACFNITIGGKSFNISSPYDTDNQNFTGDLFTQTLIYAAQSDPDLSNVLMAALTQAEKSNSDKRLKAYLNPNIAYVILDNLENLGVKMEIHKTQEEWNKFCADNKIINTSAKACLHEGVIHVKQFDFKVSYAMHEFTHLILAYLKTADPVKYQIFLDTMVSNPRVQELMKNKKGSTELDIQEEAVVEFIEEWFSEDSKLPLDNQVVIFNGYQYDAVLFMNFYLSEPIKNLFGLRIHHVPLVSFFKSLLMDVGSNNSLFGCTLFTGSVLPDTGYSTNQNKVLQALQTKLLIDYLVDKELLTKTEC